MPILSVDFDGVLHSYDSGWTAADDIPDPPVPGAMDFLIRASRFFDVAIFSSRSHQDGGIEAMKEAIRRWLIEEGQLDDVGAEHFTEHELKWPTEKPPAWVTLDDRAICFTGLFPSMEQLRTFKPWNKT